MAAIKAKVRLASAPRADVKSRDEGAVEIPRTRRSGISHCAEDHPSSDLGGRINEYPVSRMKHSSDILPEFWNPARSNDVPAVDWLQPCFRST